MREISSFCKKVDSDRTQSLLARVPIVARDQRAYSRFFEPYRNSTASKVANAANDAYLKAQGQEGVISYSRVQSLTAAYFQLQQKGTLSL